jgi:hypothetical protein
VATALAGSLALASLAVACSSDGPKGANGSVDRDRPQPATTTVPAGDELRLNQIQVVGTHNSFHEAAPPEEHALLEALDPAQAATRTYTHPSLTTQFDEQGIRQIELDVFADASGGLYADPALRGQAGLDPLIDEVPELAEPGTKVLHEQDVDYHSVCPTLVSCLTELHEWSDANPDHVPIAVDLQFKDGPLIFPVPDQAVPERWTAAAMATLDAEIASVFDPNEVITPDDVRAEASTLEASVLGDSWPTLGESRGQVLFLMLNAEPYRSTYLQAHPELRGATLFTNAEPGQPDASFVGVDDPVADGAKIDELVAAGYLVRTRSDEPNAEARTGDTTRRDAALASGAHWVSTDHPAPGSAKQLYGTDYVVELPGSVAARCNPVTAPTDCDDATIEGQQAGE